MSSLTFEVSADEAGKRLDVAIVRRLEGVGRAAAKKLIRKGSVRVNGKKVRKGAVLARGDQVEIAELPPPADFLAEPDAELPLTILYEDDDLVVIDKAAGVPSHPLRAGERGTAAGALLHRYPEMEGVGYSRREPGIVHRLDIETSGVLVAARRRETFEAMVEILRSGQMEKRYMALCLGRISAPTTVDIPLANDTRDRRRVRCCKSEQEVIRLGAREARTEILTANPVGRFCQVEVRARTARRHQIRAHLAALGHPLAGDELYGGPLLPGLDRHFLHASVVAFDHPSTGERLEIRSKLPPELDAAIAQVLRMP